MENKNNIEIVDSFKHKLIYAFKIDDALHKGIIKVGDASVDGSFSYEKLIDNSKILNQCAKNRIKDYTTTIGVEADLLYTTLAVDNKGKGFRDHDVHKVLTNSGIKRHKFPNEKNAREWFETDEKTIINAINAKKDGKASLTQDQVNNDFEEIEFRPEQKEAINKTIKRFKTSDAFLWNAKMRFGKTLSALEVIRKMSKDDNFNLKKAIIITHRPVVDKGWFEDFSKIFHDESDFLYGSKKDQTIEELEKSGKNYIYFASIQDLRGSEKVGGKFDKNDKVFSIEWDLVVIDEAHEGTLTKLGQNVTAELVRSESGKKTKELNLSGTPFNLLDNFEEKDIFTWDYIAEQKAKAEWDKNHPLEPNPYDELPKLNVYTYNLDEFLPAYNEHSDDAFNFKEFFRVWTGDKVRDRKPMPSNAKIGDFVHEKDIKKFLDMLAVDSDSGYPFSKQEYRDNFRHSLWIIPGVKEAKALSKLLKEHSVFKYFNIANVAGDGDDDDKLEDLDKVKSAITKDPLNNYSITLSCGKLTTGVTVREWSAVLYLSGSYQTKATSYLQTIFRVQSPANIKGYVKTNCYVFDFAPDRTLKMVAEAGGLSVKAGAVSSRTLMEEFLNYCSIISVAGSTMTEYSVDTMLRQLKKAYVERVVQNGFDDPKIYNDRLSNLAGVEIEKFYDLKAIVGSTKQTKKVKDIPINKEGFDNEDWLRQIEKKKKRELTEEEKKRLEEIKFKKKQRDIAISILRGISIRIPLLIYGSAYSSDKEITIDNFTEEDIIDNESWEEFMPKGVTKEKFKEFKEYYDPDIFVGAGNKIRRLAKYCDTLSPNERIKEITEIFKTFKNPDKETVLTPWRVVNMHMSDTIGGYSFYDEEFKEEIEDPRFVDRGEVTEKVLSENSKVLEINSKTGLYPLYVTYSLYRQRLSKIKKEDVTFEKELELWDETLKENVFVVCKTPMARLITIRTLAGYRDVKVNAHSFKDMINVVTNKQQQFVEKIKKPSYWNIKNKGVKEMKFDAVVGNPPYQVMDGGAQASAKPVYNYYIDCTTKISSQYVSMIMPTRWMAGGKGLDEFRNNMLNDKHIRTLHDCLTPDDIFPNTNIRGGVCYFLRDNEFDNDKDLVNVITHKDNKIIYNVKRKMRFNNLDVFIRDGRAEKIIKKVFVEGQENLSFNISSRKPFGLDGNFAKSDKFNSTLKGLKDYVICYTKGKTIGYVDKNEIKTHKKWIDKWKVFIPRANNIGTELNDDNLNAFIGKPNEICTESYLLVGGNINLDETSVNSLRKYMMTKFVRYLHGLLKASQDATSKTFELVPMQDFTNKSDIDWSKSIKEIDQQLYKKYKLTKDEIEYIETNVQEMR